MKNEGQKTWTVLSPGSRPGSGPHHSTFFGL
jgi:hypothetical protein